MSTNLKQVGSVLAIVLAVATAISAQQNSRASQVRVIKFHGDMAALLATLARDYDVVIGLEADPKKPGSEV